MNEYLNPMEKIALACESAKVAKTFTTREEGIGEDLSYNIISWHETQLTAIAQLHYQLLGADDRLTRVMEAIKALRLGYCADAVTFVVINGNLSYRFFNNFRSCLSLFFVE